MNESIEGRVLCQLFGGPLDGASYGDLPDLGGPYTGASLTIPLGQPAASHPSAVYTCTGDSPVQGKWQFFYLRTESASSVRSGERSHVTPVGAH
ncbi:hypothetical protein [Microbacterium sp. ProA8]|uniref:hypothetical protein n=1 Tax=Microbacterium chionoecetis TaxID=3153754 RepID=UPI0032656D08